MEKDYAEIRRRFLAGQSKRRIAREMHISRNTVRKYCTGANVPWKTKPYKRKNTVMTPEIEQTIVDWLNEEQDALNNDHVFKKQKYTAKRIYDRLCEEKGYLGSETTIRSKVHDLRAKMSQAFIPLEYKPGEQMQIDFGEADIYIRGEKTRIYIFCARLSYSCRPFVIAYHKQNLQVFLDALVKIFNKMGGVPERVTFDNGSVAVNIAMGTGKKAVMLPEYSRLAAHYSFIPTSCNVRQGHEKGLVEGLVGLVRRNVLVPVPRVNNIDELNQMLDRWCYNYEQHKVPSRQSSVGNLYKQEQTHLRPLPDYEYEVAESSDVKVNSYSTVQFETNRYSVPHKYVHQTVSVKAYPEFIRVYARGEVIAEHERIMDKHQTSYRLKDYMPLLEQRDRAILDAAPVKQNIPPELFEKLEQTKNHEQKIQLLKDFINGSKTSKPKTKSIKDPVQVIHTDLSQYDALAVNTSKEIAQ